MCRTAAIALAVCIACASTNKDGFDSEASPTFAVCTDDDDCADGLICDEGNMCTIGCDGMTPCDSDNGIDGQCTDLGHYVCVVLCEQHDEPCDDLGLPGARCITVAGDPVLRFCSY